jgi:hypothetical protein
MKRLTFALNIEFLVESFNASLVDDSDRHPHYHHSEVLRGELDSAGGD